MMVTDAELLRHSRRDPDAFVEVCARHATELAGWLRHEVGRDAAEDLLAETLARAWLHRRRFRGPGTGSAGPGLQGIARNLARDYRRRGAIEAKACRRLGLERVTDDGAFVETAQRLDAAAGYDAIAARMAALPTEQRAALELRVVEELGYEEIGARLAVDTVTVRTRVHRALKALRGPREGSLL
jgi:RNA polymerase sigma-70 factor (ECF subfamily)